MCGKSLRCQRIEIFYPGADVTTIIEEANHVQNAANFGYLREYPQTAQQNSLWSSMVESAWSQFAPTIGLVPKE
jgi:hypothetical protein